MSQFHAKGLVYTQLKPSKVVTGKTEQNFLFLIDISKIFALNKDLRNSLLFSNKFYVDLKYREKNMFSGRNIMNGNEPTFLDDLDSLMYLLIYFFNNGKWLDDDLPNYKDLPRPQRLQNLSTFKIISSNVRLCKNVPSKK